MKTYICETKNYFDTTGVLRALLYVGFLII